MLDWYGNCTGNSMRGLLVFIVATFFVFSARAQSNTDTLYVGQLKEVSIKARWKNDTERYRYNQMKYYVTTVLPYVEASTRLFNEVSIKGQDPAMDRREYRQFIALKQEEMKRQFEDKIKLLNVTQGALLVKLIARQTHLNIYKMVTEMKNPVVAMKWQSWALLHGMNLDKRYHPEDEPMLENIMYELGYPLPESYAVVN